MDDKETTTKAETKKVELPKKKVAKTFTLEFKEDQHYRGTFYIKSDRITINEEEKERLSKKSKAKQLWIFT